MQMGAERRNSNCNYKYNQFCNDDDDNEVYQYLGYSNHVNCCNGNGKSSKFLTLSSSPPCSPPISASPDVVGYIEHHVSKLDTLAGVAIKYGVEVADIKKINGLVTDLQMFALKSIRIPLPGRHPPSPCLSNGSDNLGQSSSEQTILSHERSNLFDSFLSSRPKFSHGKISPGMISLQGYYGLKPTDSEIASQEMVAYRKASLYLEDNQYLKPSPASNRPLSHHRKSRSLVNAFLDENSGVLADNIVFYSREDETEKLFRRRQKSEADFSAHFPEMLMREDNSGGVISAITGKGLALRPKSASRAALPADSETDGLTLVPVGMGDSVVADGFYGVRKSSSASSLHDQDSNTSDGSSIWQWSLKPDLQAFTAAAIARPIFDGLAKPMTARKNKAALD